jgi:hypothetical protein
VVVLGQGKAADLSPALLELASSGPELLQCSSLVVVEPVENDSSVRRLLMALCGMFDRGLA